MIRNLVAMTLASALLGGCAMLEPLKRQEVIIHHRALRGADTISIVGDFNDWDMEEGVMSGPDETELFTTTLRLRPGRYLLKFVINEEKWENDDWSTHIEPGNFHNSILYVGVDPADYPEDRFPSESQAERSWMATLGGETTDDRGVIELLDPAMMATSNAYLARPVYAWLPPGYHQSPERRYPVLVMLDGENTFDDPEQPFGHGGWHVNTEAERLIAEDRIEPFIIVAIPSGPARYAEYGTGENILDASNHPNTRFIIDDVLPLVRERYRTVDGPENTAVMGSSMGGFQSLFLALHSPEVFGAAGCLSSALVIQDVEGRTAFDLVRQVGKRPVRIYLDSGTDFEWNDFAEQTGEMRDLLIDFGWTLGDDLAWHLEDGAPHTERAWRERVWRPLEFLYGADTD